MRFLTAHLWPAVTPRTVFIPYGEITDKTYAGRFSTTVRLCLSLSDAKALISGRRARIPICRRGITQIGLGA